MTSKELALIIFITGLIAGSVLTMGLAPVYLKNSFNEAPVALYTHEGYQCYNIGAITTGLEKTVIHEQCHHLTKVNPQHFCGHLAVELKKSICTSS